MRLTDEHVTLGAEQRDEIRKRILRKFSITEISAVDKPAQEGAVVTIMKRADDDDNDGAGEEMVDKPHDAPRNGDGVPRVRLAKPKKRPKVKKFEIAKAAVESGETMVEKHEFLAAINKRAEKLRLPGETAAQSFARTITTDEKGRTLYAAMKIAPGKEFVEAPRVAKATAASVETGPAFAKLNALAAEYQAAQIKLGKRCTKEMAFTQVYESPANVELRLAAKREEQAAQLRRIGEMHA